MTLQLTPMTRAEFAAWRDGAQGDLADELVAVGVEEAAAGSRASSMLSDLLPDGLETKNHHLWTARRGHEQVGVVWFSLCERVGGTEAVVHDVLVEAPWRGLGLGRELMESIEAFVRDEGATSVVFRIFGHNRAGKTLCESMGYQVASTTMRKSLGAAHPRG